MSFRFQCVAIVVLVAGLSRCATLSPAPAFQDIQTIASERLGKELRWNQNSADDAAVEGNLEKLLAHPLTCDQAVQVALLKNPELMVRYEGLGIAQADLVQAGLLKNPVFDVELHFIGSGIGTGSNLNVFQDFIDVFQRPLRKRVAQANFDAIKLQIAHDVLKTASEVKVQCITLQAAAELVALNRKISQTAEAAYDIAHRQHKAGNITELDLAREEAVVTEARLELSKRELEEMQEREKLTLLLGVWDRNKKWQLAAKLPTLPTGELNRLELEKRALAQRLDLQAAKLEIESCAQKAGIAETYRLIPEFTLGVDIEGEGRSAIVPGPNFQLQLPIFDQGQARIAGAQSALRQAQQRYIALATQIRAAVRLDLNEIQTAQSKATLIQNSMLPTSERIVKLTQTQYNAMLVSVFNLVAAKRAEFEARSVYATAIKDYWIARANLERDIGGSLETSKVKS